MSKELILKGDFISYPDKVKELKKLAEDYKSLVVVKANLAEGKMARVKLREERYAIVAIEKKNNRALNDLKTKNKNMAAGLVDIIRPIEDSIDIQIKVLEQDILDEKARKREAAADLLKSQIKKASDILDYKNSEGVEDINWSITQLKSIKVTMAEFGIAKLTAQDNVNSSLEYLSAELLKTQRENAEAIYSYIDGLSELESPEDIKAKVVEVNAIEITGQQYGGWISLANDNKTEVIKWMNNRIKEIKSETKRLAMIKKREDGIADLKSFIEYDDAVENIGEWSAAEMTKYKKTLTTRKADKVKKDLELATLREKEDKRVKEEKAIKDAEKKEEKRKAAEKKKEDRKTSAKQVEYSDMILVRGFISRTQDLADDLSLLKDDRFLETLDNIIIAVNELKKIAYKKV